MKCNIKWMIISVLLIIQSIFSQELLTLDDAIAMALEKNIGIKVAKNTAEISKNNAHIGNAGLLPKIDLLSGANYSDAELISQTGTIVDQAQTITNASLQMSYTLFNGMGRIYTYKKLKSGSEYGELQARNSIESMIAHVVQSYYSVASAEENFKIVGDALNISRERLKRAENRSQFGQANTIEVLSAKVDLNTDSVTVINVLLNLDQARRNLNTLLNRDIDHQFTLNSEVQFLISSTLQELQEKAFNKNAAFLMRKKSLEQSGYDVKIATSTFAPIVALQSGYGYSQTAADMEIALDDPQKSLAAGLSLNLNLFNGFQNSINRQNAKIRTKNERLLLEKNKLELKTAVSNTYQAYKNSLFVLRVQQQNLEVAELNFQRTEELYRLGQATTTQFREAQLNLSRAKSNISTAKYNAKLNEIELLRLTGGILEK